MEQYRAILAVTSGLTGLSVLAYAIWRLSSNIKIKATAKPKLYGAIVYGCLFIGFAVIFWYKVHNENVVSKENTQNTPSGTQLQTNDNTVTAKTDDPAKSSNVNQKVDNFLDEKKEKKISSFSLKADNSSIPFDNGNVIEIKSRSVPGKGESSVDINSNKNLAPEDKVYSVVNSAFIFVEKIFNKYGNESRDHNVQTSLSDLAELKNYKLQFPTISFENGTANLTFQSSRALKELAKKLEQFPEIKIIEIQAYTNDQSPEAFNYILSEARARTIRDFLIAQGISGDRLLAKGFGSTTGDSLRILSSRIEFVAKPQ